MSLKNQQIMSSLNNMRKICNWVDFKKKCDYHGFNRIQRGLYGMKKLLAGVLACLFLVACNEKKEDTLVLATSADYPPFEFYKNGEIVGFEMDLAKIIAEKLQKKLEIKDVSFDGIIAGLQTNRYDISISAISSTPEREAKVDFCTPHHRSVAVMLLPSNSSITGVQDLSGKVLGVQMGTTYETLARNDWAPTVKELKIRSLSKVPDLLQDFRSNRIDVIVLGISEAEQIVKSYGDLKMVPLPGTESICSIALPKGSELKEKINVILADLEKSGQLKALEQKWLHQSN
jgi:ABC-type amino acid transport substrate-binding protein